MFRVLLLSLACVTLWGCGPDQTTKSKEDAQIEENIAEQRELLSPLAGRYRGTLIQANGARLEALLVLALVNVPVQNTGRNQSSTVPTLQGSLSWCARPGTCTHADNTNQVFSGSTNSASYDQGKGRLILYWDVSHSASNLNSDWVQIDGVLKNNRYHARFTTADDLEAGELDVTRVQ